ncbi:pseudouridine synthase [Thermotalea metallivorans]|uniref:Pseudouridine synthase n=1 Tax=Thermotalea metallivorans TaxID=520762 RepID=A0A140L8G6_9FIRM|nr:pseudouridine synthase [Thermotalea metallivorans]KXG76841.1 Ribosomal large subunit pseudouridine synthase B [Thermotalea metallivorans]
MRLQKYIAQSGIASRRKAEELIRSGKVKVNGVVIENMGAVIDPSSDVITVDDKIVKIEEKKVYIMLHKPEGFVTTVSDEFNRPAVIDLVKDIKERIYPVGRLDYDTSGLLLMTNDGDLTYRLTHPKHEIPKTYIAKVRGHLAQSAQKKFRQGIDIGGYITAPASLEVLKLERDTSVVKVVIHEGKNRQIRRMFDHLGHPVVSLKRVAIGKLNIDQLPRGKWRCLSPKEVAYLKSLSR